MKRVVVLLFMLPFFVACSAYHPLKDDRGYASYGLSEGRTRVIFIGDYRMSMTATREYALVRAAELTVQAGFPAFRVLKEETYMHDNSYFDGGGVITDADTGHEFIVSPSFLSATFPEIIMTIQPVGAGEKEGVPVAWYLARARQLNLPLESQTISRAETMLSDSR